jgi:D-alanyl-lipoteichoic acid acyltransferase DltB (MBOAT superfamily)
MQNFDRPYHARTISEFWRRWHISLSTWFRDYLYFPLGGNRVTAARWTFNILVVFLVSGLWHGANWTYVVWGGLHGCFLLFGAATLAFRERLTDRIGLGIPLAVRRAAQACFTFGLVCITWIFFRAASVEEAWLICKRLFTGWSSVFQLPMLTGQFKVVPLSWLAAGVAGIVTMELVESWRARDRSTIPERPWWYRWALYYGVAGALLFLHTPESIQFIYFQF